MAGMSAVIGRLLVVGLFAAFVVSTLSDLWVTTIRSFGGQGSLRIYNGQSPWSGYFWPWVWIAFVAVGGGAIVALARLARRHPITGLERLAYLIAGVVGAASMGIALWVGPGGSVRFDNGFLMTRSGMLAVAGLFLAGSPALIGLLMSPARRLAALAAVVCLAVLAVAPTLNPPALPPQPVSGPIPDWRTTPEEPYPFTRPVPPLVATAIDGTYDRPPTDTYPGQRPGCTRCAPFPQDAGRSTLTFDRGRYYLSQQQPRYRSSGHFMVAGTHVTLFNDPECSKVRGVYRWRVTDGRLHLTTLFDPCAFGQRARDLTDTEWMVLSDGIARRDPAEVATAISRRRVGLP